MFIGALLVCASLYDVSTCDVRLNTTKTFESKQLCVEEMKGAAEYAAKSLLLVAKPYCFPTKGQLI